MTTCVHTFLFREMDQVTYMYGHGIYSAYIFKPSTYKYTPIYANLSITVCAFDCVHTKYVRFGLGLCNFESHEAEHNVSSGPRCTFTKIAL